MISAFDNRNIFWGGLFLGFIILPLAFFLKNLAFIIPCFAIILVLSLVFPFLGLLFLLPLLIWLPAVDFLLKGSWYYIIAAIVLNIAGKCFLLKNRTPILCSRKSTLTILSSLFLIFYIGFMSFLHGIPLGLSIYKMCKLGAFLSIGVCVMIMLSTPRQINIFLEIFVFTVGVSAIVGLLQFLKIDFFWQLRELFPIRPLTRHFIEIRYRITGLADYNIPLTYQLIQLIPVTLASIFIHKDNPLKKFYYALFLSVFFATSLATLSRGAAFLALLGIGIGLIGYWNFKKVLYWGVCISLISILFFINTRGNRLDRLFDLEHIDITTFDRIPIQKIALKIALSNPFGMPPSEVDSRLSSYSSEFFASFRNYVEKYSRNRIHEFPDYVKNHGIPSPHNQFLNVLLMYGFAGFILLVLFYTILLSGLLAIIKDKLAPYETRSLAKGVLCSLFVYILHSLVHNNGPFLEDQFSWIIIGLALVVFNQSDKALKTAG